ncbi:MAG TPA: hypothetical protein VF070_05310 [Streptosporangiaceae bacterium]
MVYMEYLTGEHFAGLPDDAGHHSAVTERLPAAATPRGQTTQILADMLREFQNPGTLAQIGAMSRRVECASWKDVTAKNDILRVAPNR